MQFIKITNVKIQYTVCLVNPQTLIMVLIF